MKDRFDKFRANSSYTRSFAIPKSNKFENIPLETDVRNSESVLAFSQKVDWTCEPSPWLIAYGLLMQRCHSNRWLYQRHLNSIIDCAVVTN